MATLVGSPARAFSGGAGTTVAVTYGTAVQVNDVIVVAVGGYDDVATINVPTDNLSTPTTYTRVGTLLRGSGANSGADRPMLDVFVGPVVAAGTPTVTATFTGGSPIEREIKVWVWRGVDTTTPVNATNGATGTTDNASATGNIVTTSPGPIMAIVNEFAWAASHSEAAGSPSTGWTEFGDTATGSDSKYRNETGTGTFNGDFTWSAALDEWATRIVALSDAAAVGAGAQRRPLSLRPAPFAPGGWRR